MIIGHDKLSHLLELRKKEKKTFSLGNPGFSFPLRAALTATSKLYDSVDDALHRLVQVSNQRGSDLDALGRLAGLVDRLEKVRWEDGDESFTNRFTYVVVKTRNRLTDVN